MSKRKKLSVKVYREHKNSKEPELKILPSFKDGGIVCNRCGRSFKSKRTLIEHRNNYCPKRPK